MIGSFRSLFGQSIKPFGSQVNFTHYFYKQGLTSPNIRCVFQDSRGLLWVGAMNGLFYYDGVKFNKLSSKNGFGNLDVGSLTEDKNGRVWIGTMDGLFYFEGNKVHRIDTAGTNMPRNMCWSLYCDNDGSMWAGSINRIYHFNFDDKKTTLIKRYHMSNDKNLSIRYLKRKKNGTMIAGSESGYYIYKPDTFMRSDATNFSIYNLIELDNGSEITSGWGSPLNFIKNDKSEKAIDVGSGILTITKDNKNNIWLATWDKGIFKYDGNNITNYSFNEGLSYNSFWSSYTDREGNLWFGSWGNGLYKFSNDGFININEKNGLHSNLIMAMTQDTSGNVYMASEVALSKYNLATRTFTNYTTLDGKPLNILTNLYIDDKNELWAFSYGGNGYRLSNNKLIQERYSHGFQWHKEKDGYLYVATENALWLCNTPDSGLIKVRPYNNKRLKACVGFYFENKNRIWMYNSFFGVSLFNGKTAYNFNQTNGLIREAVNAVTKDKNGNYWLGSSGRGIYYCKLVNDTTIKILDSLTVQNGLGSDIINSLTIHKNKLIAGTAFGLSMMDLDAYKNGDRSFKNYTKENGLVDNSCSVSFIDKNGKIWIKTSQGAFVFDPSTTNVNTKESSTLLTEIKLYFKTVNWEDQNFKTDILGIPHDLVLPYDQNHLTFYFNGICLTAPSGVRYQFKLEGLDPDWSPITNKHEATYSNIPPGTYKFFVRSCNNDGLWNAKPTEFSFTITPPFWKQNWFYLLLIISVSSAVYLFIKYREKKLKVENENLERKITERTLQLKNAFLEIEEKNKDIQDSIVYAKRIQEAILPAKELKHKLFPNAFVLYQPRDIVSGDFYWFTEKNGKRLIAAVDCTGHGVPGAFMSLIGSTILNEIVNVQGIIKPSQILNKLRDQIIHSLKQKDGNNKDGMDISLLCFNENENLVEFAAANNPLWIIRNNEVIEVKADKQPVGYSGFDLKDFTNHSLKLEKGDMLYLFSDGYADQFGGVKGKKYKYNTLKNFLISINHLSVAEQETKLLEEFSNWKGDLEQVDDVCIIGIKI